MNTREILAIILFIVIGLAAINLLGDPRLNEGFKSKIEEQPYGLAEKSNLRPDVAESDPAHLLKSEIETTRPFNTFGTLTQQQCFEQDGTRLPEKLGDYSQRTNNYKHTYPDSCSAPYKELVGSFYAPREGSIGSPIPGVGKMPTNNDCNFAQ
jgi:hypothetical protein